MPPKKISGKTENERKQHMWALEHECYADGAHCVAGVDEAGRGPLAGPVVVAAVILPPDSWLRGLNDSKKVSASTRDRLFDEIQQLAIAYAVEVIPVEMIDTINILKATHHGMRSALCHLSQTPDLALIDGLPIPDPPVPQRNIVKGDSRSASIAAASILAKVTRDRLMVAYDDEYPGYGFAQHKGYPTADHVAALHRLGPCVIHRRSFAPVQLCLQNEFLFDVPLETAGTTPGEQNNLL